MKKLEIYLLVDIDGEVICAYTDRDIAIEQAKDSCCDVETTSLYSE